MEKIKSNYNENILNDKYNELKNNPDFITLINKFKISETEIKNNLSSLEDTLNELHNCKKCPGLSECKNKIKGYVYYPENKESFLCFGYAKCKKLKEYENILTEKDENNELKNARMKDIDVSDKNRIELIKFLKKFYDEYNIKSSPKGLYLHGSFGSGKTFLLACLLNELEIKKHISYEIVYYPELLRTLKEDLSLVESKVSYYSNVEILVLDDIGAENTTNWSRDEVLAPLLQYRMENHLSTFFTSNLTKQELELTLSNTSNGIDKIKARRIIERINQLTVDLELISKNRRN